MSYFLRLQCNLLFFYHFDLTDKDHFFWISYDQRDYPCSINVGYHDSDKSVYRTAADRWIRCYTKLLDFKKRVLDKKKLLAVMCIVYVFND